MSKGKKQVKTKKKSNKPKKKYDEKIKVDASFEELLKMAAAGKTKGK